MAIDLNLSAILIKVLITNGFNEPNIIKKFNQPALNIFNFLNKDPFYCLIATKN